MAAPHVPIPRKGVSRRELLGVAEVDARRERLGDDVGRERTELPADQLAEGPLGPGLLRPPEDFREAPQLGSERDQRGDRRLEGVPGGRPELAPPDQVAAAYDGGRLEPVLVGPDRLQKNGDRRAALAKRRGPELDEPPVLRLGPYRPAHPVPDLEHPDRVPEPGQLVGRGESGHPAPEDGDPLEPSRKGKDERHAYRLAPGDDRLDQGLDAGDLGVREDAVPQVEDVPRDSPHGPEQPLGLPPDDRGTVLRSDRVEVALDRDRGPGWIPGPGEGRQSTVQSIPRTRTPAAAARASREAELRRKRIRGKPFGRASAIRRIHRSEAAS